jgi:hypothetical protein
VDFKVLRGFDGSGNESNHPDSAEKLSIKQFIFSARYRGCAR